MAPFLQFLTLEQELVVLHCSMSFFKSLQRQQLLNIQTSSICQHCHKVNYNRSRVFSHVFSLSFLSL